MEVGEVLQVYDNNKRFPAWGFGQKVNYGPVSHCFNLSGNDDNCEVEGVQGIMDAYKNALHNVTLQGPTLFGQVINKAIDIAAQSLSTNPTKYFVLLIIMDGVLTNLQETQLSGPLICPSQLF
ncbi:putative copine, protein BONZAI, von Willebrand factor A-like domain superfamily [Helianthus debilis subsp. tardiflorus]